MAEAAKKKLSKKIIACWPSRTISTSVAAALTGYITFFATDYLGLSAATVGLLFMASKIFDGVTDLIVGFIIDRLNLKLGKGRPYELALIGYWLCIVLMFSVPEMGIAPTYVYVFIMYTLINSVFMTFLNCSEAVYLSNVIDEPEHVITVSAVTGFISLIFTMVASMVYPTVVDTIGTTRQGWFLIAAVTAVPMTLLGLCRFLFIKERTRKNVSAAAKFTVKDMINVIAKNKYICIFALIILLSNAGSTLHSGVQTYYFQYIIGDLSLASLLSLSMLSIIIMMVLVPMLSKKFGFVNVIRATTVCGIAGYLVRLIAPKSIALLFVSNVFALMGFYTMFSFGSTFIIDCMDYGEWKNGVRSEGAITCVQSFTAKIGTAFGTGAIGVLMGLSGYNGSLEVQSASANTMILMLFTVVPAIFCLVQFILLKLFDLDKSIDGIRAELKERHAASE